MPARPASTAQTSKQQTASGDDLASGPANWPVATDTWTLRSLARAVAPVGGSVLLHASMLLVLIFSTWTIFDVRQVRPPEYEVGIVERAGVVSGGPLDWSVPAEAYPSDTAAGADVTNSDQPPDLSALLEPAPDRAGQVETGGFGVGDSGRSGILGIGSGAGRGGGAGIGSGFGRGEGLGRTGIWGLSARGESFAYVVDFSGSLTIVVDQLKRELKRSVGRLQSSQRFNVIIFYSVGTQQGEQYRTESFASGLVNATPENKRRFFSWLSTKQPTGRTEPLPALLRALALKPDAVFLFSDGYFEKEDRVLVEVREANRTVGAQIHCIVIDELLFDLQRETEGVRRLRRLADDHNGKIKVVTRRDLENR